ncbi:hypothetical protein DEU56DRAFT_769378, partial [Suillus clintonianus]|uniref:uncharacterized protein n=1 Tax=Suillus clintonianus TaxID=1904413 RepID=UPI001B87DC6D
CLVPLLVRLLHPLSISPCSKGVHCDATTPQTPSLPEEKKRVYVAPPPVKTTSKAQTGQSPSTVAQPASQPHSTPQRQPEAQTATQQPTQEEDYGC